MADRRGRSIPKSDPDPAGLISLDFLIKNAYLTERRTKDAAL
jgi:hypothetical protein